MLKIRDLVCENPKCANKELVLSDQWVETIAGREVDQACVECHRALAKALSPIHIGASGGKEKTNKPGNGEAPCIETTPIGNFNVYGMASPQDNIVAIVDANTNSPVAYGHFAKKSPESDGVIVQTGGIVRKDFQDAISRELREGGDTEKPN